MPRARPAVPPSEEAEQRALEQFQVLRQDPQRPRYPLRAASAQQARRRSHWKRKRGFASELAGLPTVDFETCYHLAKQSQGKRNQYPEVKHITVYRYSKKQYTGRKNTGGHKLRWGRACSLAHASLANRHPAIPSMLQAMRCLFPPCQAARSPERNL